VDFGEGARRYESNLDSTTITWSARRAGTVTRVKDPDIEKLRTGDTAGTGSADGAPAGNLRPVRKSLTERRGGGRDEDGYARWTPRPPP